MCWPQPGSVIIEDAKHEVVPLQYLGLVKLEFSKTWFYIYIYMYIYIYIYIYIFIRHEDRKKKKKTNMNN